MRWRIRSRGTTREVNVAAAPRGYDNEFDAFLGGAYVEWLVESHHSAPPWAWVNCLAHGTVAELQRLMTRDTSHPSRDLEEWRHVVSVMARDVLALAPDDASLDNLQMRALVPLELQLAQRGWSQAMSPWDLVVVMSLVLDSSRGIDDRPQQ